MEHGLLIEALKAAQNGQKYAFATVVETTKKGTPRKSGAKMVVLEDGSFYGTIGGGRNEKAAQKECLKAIHSGKSSLISYDCFGKKDQSVCGGQMKIFIEPFVSERHFIICGAGHIALPLSIILKLLDYKVTIIDSRKTFANKERFPHVDRVMVGKHAQSLAKIPIDQNTFIMIVTHGHEHDFECLKTIIHKDAGYIGVISSKPKKIRFFNSLKKAGIPESRLKKISIPSGIDIGAQTPEEIAVSIAAELISVTNKGLVGSDKFKTK